MCSRINLSSFSRCEPYSQSIEEGSATPLAESCKVTEKNGPGLMHHLSSRKTVEFSFLPPLTIYVYSSVIIIEEEIWISVRIKSWPFFHKIVPKLFHIPKKRVIWGLSTFKPKSKYTVVFVDFVVCGYIKTCHVDGANYSLAQFENNWNKSVPVITISCRKEVIIVSQ